MRKFAGRGCPQPQRGLKDRKGLRSSVYDLYSAGPSFGALLHWSLVFDCGLAFHQLLRVGTPAPRRKAPK